MTSAPARGANLEALRRHTMPAQVRLSEEATRVGPVAWVATPAAGAVPGAVNDAPEFLDVDVDQLAGSLALVAAGSGRAGLACRSQSWSGSPR